jgi:hypothetical protein
MNIKDYRGMLMISKHRLDDELEIQAEIQDRIATQKALANTKQLEAKDLLMRKEGRLAEDLRDDEPKLTVGAINAKVARDPERMKAWDHYQAMRAEHEAWEGLHEAWKSRGYNLKAMADLWQAGYWTSDSYSPAGPRGKQEDRQDQRRADMRKAHPERTRDVAAEGAAAGRRQRTLVDEDEPEIKPRRRIE